MVRNLYRDEINIPKNPTEIEGDLAKYENEISQILKEKFLEGEKIELTSNEDDKLKILLVCLHKEFNKKTQSTTKKYWTHHERKYVYDVSNFFIFDFGRNEFYKARIKPCKSQKALRRKDYLLASSIATVTATCHQNNLRLFDHGGVAGSG